MRVRAEGGIRWDLTRTDPTGWKERLEAELEVLGSLRRTEAVRYLPDPAGLPGARRVLCSVYGGQPGEWILTASTSEAYSILFQLLADPGDHCAISRPSYPLLDDLARHGGVRLSEIPLRWHRGEWRLDLGWTQRILENPRTRMLALIQPGNPTGWWLNEKERSFLVGLCRDTGKAIVCDEVFSHDLHAPGFRSLHGEDACLCFVLGGLSKSLGLPHLKLGWIHVSGPQEGLEEAMERLLRLNDGLLSASTPVQCALGDLFAMKDVLRGPLERRVQENLRTLSDWSCEGIEVLRSGGGWVRILRLLDQEEESFSLKLLENGVLVQPGYLYDLPGENLVVSLLSDKDEFRQGLDIIKSIHI